MLGTRAKCFALTIVSLKGCFLLIKYVRTYISACEGKDEVFQMVQAVVDTSAPSLFHQWFHCLKRTHNIYRPGSIHEIKSKYRSQNNVKYHVSG